MGPCNLADNVIEGLDADVVRVKREDPGHLGRGYSAELGDMSSITKCPPATRWAAAFVNTETCSSCVVTFMIEFATRYTSSKSRAAPSPASCASGSTIGSTTEDAARAA